MTDSSANKAYQLAKDYEHKHGGCSQCVIAALHDAFNIRSDDIFKASTGLVGGGAGTCDGSCGAYAGAIMVTSSLHGRGREDFSKREVPLHTFFGPAMKLREKFIQEYGTIICRDIQTKVLGRPYYLADPEDFKKFEEAGGHEIHCPEVVGKAARWAAEIINEEKLIK